jgi:misacylated tRNA(Ala) deacylase
MTEPLFRTDAYTRECSARVISADALGIKLDRTIFYPLGGGQLGDIGHLALPDGTKIDIVDTRKGPGGPDDVLHVPAEGATLPSPDTVVTAVIDWERRHRLMRMHTCLHLLSAVIPGNVTGGQVSDGKGRLDFNLPDQTLDKDRIESELNRLIREDHPVRPRWITDQELAAQPELVRTMSVKPPTGYGKVRLLDIEGVDLQPCGGTHVAQTGEIGPVVVTKIESKGKQNRRVNIAFVEAGQG